MSLNPGLLRSLLREGNRSFIRADGGAAGFASDWPAAGTGWTEEIVWDDDTLPAAGALDGLLDDLVSRRIDAIDWSLDGRHILLANTFLGGHLYTFICSTPFDPSTASQTGVAWVGDGISASIDTVGFFDKGRKFFYKGSTDVYTICTLTVPYEMEDPPTISSSATETDLFGVYAQTDDPPFALNEDGTYMICIAEDDQDDGPADDGWAWIHIYPLSTAGDISTALKANRLSFSLEHELGANWLLSTAGAQSMVRLAPDAASAYFWDLAAGGREVKRLVFGAPGDPTTTTPDEATTEDLSLATAGGGDTFSVSGDAQIMMTTELHFATNKLTIRRWTRN